jgi:hypothetical protein
VNLTQTVNNDSADECEHCRELDEPKQFEIILGLRRLVQKYQYTCNFGHNASSCLMPARACRVKIECDNNVGDIASIAIIELGTSDIEFVSADNSDGWTDYDEFGVAEDSQ